MKRSIKPQKIVTVGHLLIGSKEKKYINEVLNSHRLSYGPFTRKLEKEFAKLHDCKYAIFCNSGTSALHIALAALKEYYGWKDGDEVIVPAVTFVATSNIVLHNNMKPVFVDVDPRTYNIDPNLIKEKITKRTRCIIPVHLMGLPCDMERIMSIALKHNLKVIEDSCETMFSSCDGKKVGSFGDIGCFSTYIAHYIITGVGGFATTNNSKLCEILQSLMNHGRDNIYISIDDDNVDSDKRLFEVVSKRFSFIRLGHSFRATELESAIGLAQLEKRDEFIKIRKENARTLIQGLSDLKKYIQLPYVPANCEHCYMLFPIVTLKEPKTELIRFLEKSGIETRDLMPLVTQPIYRKLFGKIENQFKVALWLNQNGFYIGCHPYLTKKDLEYVIEVFHNYFNR